MQCQSVYIFFRQTSEYASHEVSFHGESTLLPRESLFYYFYVVGGYYFCFLFYLSRLSLRVLGLGTGGETLMVVKGVMICSQF
jgi:hypothetical protein